MKVFIADDSNAVVERLADLLEEVPGVHLVGRAHDVSEAVNGVQSMNPDVLILDLQMPGGNGIDVLRAVRVHHPYLQILICTNYPYSKYRKECFDAGANFFLDKSAEFERIPAILRGLFKDSAKVPSATG